MPKEQWTTSQLPKRVGNETWDLDVCPGYTSRLPMVEEVASAWKAFDKGCWESFYPDASHCMCEGVLLLDNAITANQSWVYDHLKDQSGS